MSYIVAGCTLPDFFLPRAAATTAAMSFSACMDPAAGSPDRPELASPGSLLARSLTINLLRPEGVSRLGRTRRACAAACNASASAGASR